MAAKRYERLDPVLERVIENGLRVRLTFFDGDQITGYVEHSEGYPYHKPYRIHDTVFCKSQVVRIDVRECRKWDNI